LSAARSGGELTDARRRVHHQPAGAEIGGAWRVRTSAAPAKIPVIDDELPIRKPLRMGPPAGLRGAGG
jgi:hypothetical protein